MEITAIINTLLSYGSFIVLGLYALITAVQLIVEVVKRLLPKVPTDLVVVIVSIALTVLALFIGAEILEITVMWYYAVGAVVLGIFVAWGAMNGWEKCTEIFSRLKEMVKKK